MSAASVRETVWGFSRREDFWFIERKMRQKSRPVKRPAEELVKDIRRATRRHARHRK